MDNATKGLLVCRDEGQMKEVVRRFTNIIDNDFVAREIMQAMTSTE